MITLKSKYYHISKFAVKYINKLSFDFVLESFSIVFFSVYNTKLNAEIFLTYINTKSEALTLSIFKIGHLGTQTLQRCVMMHVGNTKEVCLSFPIIRKKNLFYFQLIAIVNFFNDVNRTIYPME